VATVIYTRSLKPVQAVVLSGVMNFAGVLAGGLSVAYALVELLPPDVLTPPNGAPAVPMLFSLFGAALSWNLLTWRAGIPNSSSHCIIGSIIGVAVGDALVHGRHYREGIDWPQVLKVLEALAVSPILGLVGAGLFYCVRKMLVKDKALFEPPQGHQPPRGWVRWLLIGSCTGVSFSHGSNDGQKSIGLIMLTVAGLWPALYALNPQHQHTLPVTVSEAHEIRSVLDMYDHDVLRSDAMIAAQHLQTENSLLDKPILNGPLPPLVTVRSDVFQIVAALKKISLDKAVPSQVRHQAAHLRMKLRPVVEFAPWWVRLLSALCLSLGTMVGYKRIVSTLGEKIGRTHLTPAQGASSELVGAGLILTAGYTGLPVSTTHIVTAGIAGSMLGAGSGLQWGTMRRIMLAWVATLPVTIVLSAGLFYLLSH